MPASHSSRYSLCEGIGTFSKVLQEGQQDEVVVIRFEFHTGQFGDGRLFEFLLPEHLGLKVVELLEKCRRSALFTVVLMVADEEGT